MLCSIWELRASRDELGAVRGHTVAATFSVGCESKVDIFKDNGIKRNAQLTHLVCDIALGGGAGLGTDGLVFEVGELRNPTVLAHHNALAVVEHHGGKGEVIGTIASQSPGGVTAEDINLTGLQGGKSFFGIEGTIFNSVGIIEDCCGDRLTNVYI